MKKLLLPTIAAILLSTSIQAGGYKVVKSYDCPAANQGVAVDDNHFYAIGNQTVVKYNLAGDSLAVWKDTENIKHFDGGIVIDGLLYCSHSNFPDVPMASSIEIFDVKTMKHVRTVSLGIDNGSCTWIVRDNGCWYVCFAHYDRSGANAGGEVLKDASWTQVVQYDDNFRRLQGWILPKELVDQLRPHSLSGALLIDGKLYCTGHDAKQLFILEFPPCGMILRWTGSIDIPFKGQGIAMDRKGNLWGIDRKKHQVVKTSIK